MAFGIKSWGQVLREFDLLHGDYVTIQDTKYFQDGAVRQMDGALSVWNNPPSDPAELRQRKRIFWETKLSQAVEAFHQRKSQLQRQTKDGLVVVDRELDELKELQKAVRSAKVQLKALEPPQPPTLSHAEWQAAWNVYNSLQAALQTCREAEAHYHAKPTEKRREQYREAFEAWENLNSQFQNLSGLQKNAIAKELNDQLRDRQQRRLDAIEV